MVLQPPHPTCALPTNPVSQELLSTFQTHKQILTAAILKENKIKIIKENQKRNSSFFSFFF